MSRFRKPGGAIRWWIYKHGFRPKPGSPFYSAHLDRRYKVKQALQDAVSGLRPHIKRAEDRMSPHRWVLVEEGSLMTGGVPFRFCSRCDREEWDNGVIRSGLKEKCDSPR